MTLMAQLLGRMWASRIMLAGCALIGAAILVGSSFLMPVKYKASAKVIPASLVSDGGSMPVSGSLISMAQNAGFSLGGGSSDPSSLVPEILKSEDFTSRILVERYATSSGDSIALLDALDVDGDAQGRVLSRAHRALRGGILSSTYDAKSGVTSISVLMKDSVLAADIANRVVMELDAFNLQMRTSQARFETAFISRRLQEVEQDLRVAEESLANFREQNRTISASPQLLLESGRLERNVELQQSLFVTLKTQEEVALIQELKSVPSLRVLERARVPLFKHSPRRGVMAVTGFILGLGVALIVLLYRWLAVRTG